MAKEIVPVSRAGGKPLADSSAQVYEVGRIPWSDFAAYALSSSIDARAAVDKLRAAHGPLSESVVHTALMALYCCIYHDDFPHNFLDCCRAIGRGRPLPMRLCLHISPARWEEAHGYIAGLRAWLDGAEPRAYAAAFGLDGSMPAWIHSLLGDHSPAKDALAARTLASLVAQLYRGVRFMIISDDAGVSDREGYRRFDGLVHREDGTHYASLVDADGGPSEPELAGDDPAAREVDLHLSMERPACAQKLFRYWEIVLSSVGVLKWRGAVPGGGRSREDYEQEFAAYLSAAAEWSGRHKHLTAEGRHVADALGDYTPLKHNLVDAFLLQPAPEPGFYDFLRNADPTGAYSPYTG